MYVVPHVSANAAVPRQKVAFAILFLYLFPKPLSSADAATGFRSIVVASSLLSLTTTQFLLHKQ